MYCAWSKLSPHCAQCSVSHKEEIDQCCNFNLLVNELVNQLLIVNAFLTEMPKELVAAWCKTFS